MGLLRLLHPTLSSSDTAKQTGDDQKAIAEYQGLFDVWNQHENLVHAQLAASIEDSMLMKLSHCDSAAHMWKTLCYEFEGKTRMVQVDLRRKMLEMKANEGDNIPAHLDAIRHIYERLSGMGAPPSEDDYSSMIILTLPESYQILLTTLGDAAQQANNPLTSDNYITKAVQEYERRHVRNGKSSNPKDAAFSAFNRNGGRNRNNSGNSSGYLNSHNGSNSSSGSKKHIECHNCHKCGHYKSNCWAKGGGKEGQGPCTKRNSQGKGNDTANAVASVEDGCWLATTKDPIEEQTRQWRA